MFSNKRKKIIEFYYNGGLRIVEPFCYGVSSAGNEVLRAYQIGGYSESGNPIGWKLFKVCQMSNLHITDKHFTNIRTGYNPNDSAMITIYSHI